MVSPSFLYPRASPPLPIIATSPFTQQTACPPASSPPLSPPTPRLSSSPLRLPPHPRRLLPSPSPSECCHEERALAFAVSPQLPHPRASTYTSPPLHALRPHWRNIAPIATRSPTSSRLPPKPRSPHIQDDEDQRACPKASSVENNGRREMRKESRSFMEMVEEGDDDDSGFPIRVGLCFAGGARVVDGGAEEEDEALGGYKKEESFSG
ncbi:uncharacterized protein A4U43_C08F13440 [Asparagus officinalis]|nr:uncharacterized protein A4U43_C08F13440 [Asparagus officinalis]